MTDGAGDRFMYIYFVYSFSFLCETALCFFFAAFLNKLKIICTLK